MEISARDMMECLREAEMLGREDARCEYKSTVLMLEDGNVALQRANDTLQAANCLLYEEKEQLAEQIRQHTEPEERLTVPSEWISPSPAMYGRPHKCAEGN